MRNFSLILIIVFFGNLANAQERLHWVLTNGLGTDTPAILVVNTNGDIIAGAGKNIVRSSDRGKHWAAFPLSNYGDVIAATAAPGAKILVFTNSGSLVRVDSDGSSLKVLLNIGHQNILSPPLFTDLSGIVYFVRPNSDYIFRSQNIGDSWDTIKGPAAETINSFSSDNQQYYITTTTGIYTSTDYGLTWKRPLNGILIGNFYDIVAGRNGMVLASGNVDSRTSTWFRSNDYGQTWRSFGTNGDKAYEAAIRSDNAAILFGGDEIIAYRNDTSIVRVDGSIYGTALRGAFDSSGNWLGSTGAYDQFAHPSSNLFYSNGGLPWKWDSSPAALSSPTFLMPAFSTAVVGSGNNNFIYDTILGWVKIPGSSAPLAMDYYDGSLLETTSNGGLLHSTDTGHTWRNIFPAISGKISAAAVSPSTLYAASDRVYKSIDSGNNWSETNDNILTGAITALSSDSSGRLYAACSAGLFASTNGGDTWSKTQWPSSLSVVNMSVNESGMLAVTSSDKFIRRSNDKGTTWDSASILRGTTVTGMVLTAKGDAFASSDSGIFYWPLGAPRMYDASDGINGRSITALASDINGTLYAATNGIGVLKSVGDASMLGVREQTTTAQMIASPNPASSTVRISVPYPDHWSVIAIDELGREFSLSTRVRSETMECNVSSLAPGAYELIARSTTDQYHSRIQIVR